MLLVTKGHHELDEEKIPDKASLADIGQVQINLPSYSVHCPLMATGTGSRWFVPLFETKKKKNSRGFIGCGAARNIKGLAL